jgi:hypothetical protein
MSVEERRRRRVSQEVFLAPSVEEYEGPCGYIAGGDGASPPTSSSA